jgi:hypothetical protein
MALIQCDDCGKEVSDLAPACPNCGRPGKAMDVSMSEPSSQPPPKPVPSCPFCHYPLPDPAAEVCRCGAYFGYKRIHAERDFVVGIVLFVIGLIALLVAVSSSGEIITQIVSGLIAFVFGLSGLGHSVGNGFLMLGGKKWWRKF